MSNFLMEERMDTLVTKIEPGENCEKKNDNCDFYTKDHMNIKSPETKETHIFFQAKMVRDLDFNRSIIIPKAMIVFVSNNP